MHFDALEPRRHLSVTYVAGELRLLGTNNPNAFSVAQVVVAGKPILRVVDDGTLHSYNLNLNPVSIIRANLLGGADTLTVTTKAMTIPVSADGGDGNDTIDAAAGDDHLVGGLDDDRLLGRNGDDTLFGGAGLDLLLGGNDADYLWGESDDDTLFGEAGTDNANGGDDSDDLVDGGTEDDTLHGATGDDTVLGRDGDDVLYGDDGRDSMDGGAGADTMFGGNQSDTLAGGDHDDVLAGDAQPDSLTGGPGADQLYGGADADIIAGDAGPDLAYGDEGNDTIEGGDGPDTLSGDAGRDDLAGGRHDDDLRGGAEPDTLSGNAGNDRLHGDAGPDLLHGNAGNDALYGGPGQDDLRGGGGLDGLFGGLGAADTLTGGAGADRFLDRYLPGIGKTWDDDVTDRQNDDARVGFKDEPNEYTDNDSGGIFTTYAPGAWSDADIEAIDLGLAALHLVVGNVTLLEQKHGSTIEFARFGDVVDTNDTAITYATNDGALIRIFQATFNGDLPPAQVAIHEVGHHWDTEYDKRGWWDLSGWERGNNAPSPNHVQGYDPKFWYDATIANFNSDYARTDPYEDFAEAFTEYFMDADPNLIFEPIGSLENILSKSAFFDAFLADIS